MANAYFTFPALLVVYVAQRAVELRADLLGPRVALPPRPKHLGALRTAVSSA